MVAIIINHGVKKFRKLSDRAVSIEATCLKIYTVENWEDLYDYHL